MEKIQNNQKIEKPKKVNEWDIEWEYCLNLYKDNVYEALKEFYKKEGITNFIEIYTLELNRDYVYDNFKNEKDINKILEYMIDKQNDVALAIQSLVSSGITNAFTNTQKEIWAQNLPHYMNEEYVDRTSAIDAAAKEGIEKMDDIDLEQMWEDKDNDMDTNIERFKKITEVLEYYYMDCKSGRKAFLKEDMDMLKILLPIGILEQYGSFYEDLKFKEIEEKIKSGK